MIAKRLPKSKVGATKSRYELPKLGAESEWGDGEKKQSEVGKSSLGTPSLFSERSPGCAIDTRRILTVFGQIVIVTSRSNSCFETIGHLIQIDHLTPWICEIMGVWLREKQQRNLAKQHLPKLSRKWRNRGWQCPPEVACDADWRSGDLRSFRNWSNSASDLQEHPHHVAGMTSCFWMTRVHTCTRNRRNCWPR